MQNFAFCIESEILKIKKWLFFNVFMNKAVKIVVKAKKDYCIKRIFLKKISIRVLK